MTFTVVTVRAGELHTIDAPSRLATRVSVTLRGRAATTSVVEGMPSVTVTGLPGSVRPLTALMTFCASAAVVTWTASAADGEDCSRVVMTVCRPWGLSGRMV